MEETDGNGCSRINWICLSLSQSLNLSLSLWASIKCQVLGSQSLFLSRILWLEESLTLWQLFGLKNRYCSTSWSSLFLRHWWHTDTLNVQCLLFRDSQACFFQWSSVFWASSLLFYQWASSNSILSFYHSVSLEGLSVLVQCLHTPRRSTLSSRVSKISSVSPEMWRCGYGAANNLASQEERDCVRRETV